MKPVLMPHQTFGHKYNEEKSFDLQFFLYAPYKSQKCNSAAGYLANTKLKLNKKGADFDISASQSISASEKHLWLCLHFQEASNNQTWQDGKLACTFLPCR